MNLTEINEIKRKLLIKHYSAINASGLAEKIYDNVPGTQEMVDSTVIGMAPLESSKTIWQTLFIFLEHMLTTYHNGQKFTFKWHHFARHIKTLKLVVKIFQNL